ncbi:hypothetical protein BS78_08G136400 [Paspalum vaginatum]|nr:hypothetical protein BS78_08G136400 [Paspalum vaginatum]
MAWWVIYKKILEVTLVVFHNELSGTIATANAFFVSPDHCTQHNTQLCLLHIPFSLRSPSQLSSQGRRDHGVAGRSPSIMEPCGLAVWPSLSSSTSVALLRADLMAQLPSY